jgi:hypothetical protein
MIYKLEHPNIIRIIDFIEQAIVEKSNGQKYSASCIIIEEIATGGELFYFVLNSGFFSENLARYYFK